MPIAHRIDSVRRIVFARGHGVVTDADAFGYQREVWSRTETEGFDEVVDMTEIEEIVFPSAERVDQLARFSAGCDAPGATAKLAIVAPADMAYGLGRMYQAYREMAADTKEVGVFRSMSDALQWIEAEGLPST